MEALHPDFVDAEEAVAQFDVAYCLPGWKDAANCSNVPACPSSLNDLGKPTNFDDKYL